jgi:hypothetical protein
MAFVSRRRGGLAAVVFLAIFGAIAAADPIRYDNHKLVQVSIKSPADLKKMLAISEDHWSCSVGLGIIPFHVPPDRMADLVASGLDYRVVHENIQQLIDAEQASMQQRGGWFTSYHNFADVNTYLDGLATARPDLAARFNVGQSLEGRTMSGIRITGAGGVAGKPAVLFSGCQHAREWVAVSTPVYVADQLINLYDSDPDVHALLDRAVVYIVPIVNPDGYVYTWTTDRLWRKNRRNNGGGTFGVDLNRNWGTGWGLDSGSSPNGSSETYRGTAPFSEPETQVLRNFVLAHPELEAHIDFHSFSQLILWAWGYQSGQPANPAGAILTDIGTRMQDAILGVHGVGYTAGPAGDTLYLASGVFPDWTFQDRGMWSYTIELRPDPNSSDGFVLPPAQIIPTGEENFEAIKELIGFVALPLSFQFPNGLPATLVANQSTAIDVNISNGAGTLNPASATLQYRIGPTGGFTAVALTSVGGSTYRGSLPATACGQTVYFYFEAATTTGDVMRSPSDAPATLYSAQSRVITNIFSDTMETNLGWVAGAAGDTATSGVWNRVNPQGTTAQPEDDHTVTGTICWVTNGTAGASAGANDVDNGITTLLSPVFDLAATNDPTIGYWRWYSNDAGGDPNNDVFTVDITTNGTAWTNVETVGPSGAGTGGGWFYHEFHVRDLVTPSTTTRLRFIAADLGTGSLIEAAVDDFAIVDQGCPGAPPCPGDVNGDGVRDLADLTLLLGAFGSSTGDPAFNAGADLDGDGTIALADLTSLLSTFGVACPP